MSQRGKLIVIVAPSGTGKSSLIEKVMQKTPSLKWSVSCTTRPMREGEQHGRDYFFMPEAEFIKKKDNGELIEWAKVHSNYYGTSKQFVEDGLNSGENLLFDLDVQGCDSMKKVFGDEANVIFIEPPSVEELEKRLLNRATDSVDVINERLSNAKKELLRKDDYDFKVTNDNFDTALQNLINVINSILAE